MEPEEIVKKWANYVVGNIDRKDFRLFMNDRTKEELRIAMWYLAGYFSNMKSTLDLLVDLEVKTHD